MADNLRSDGKAVEVVLGLDVTKGDAVRTDGWFGVAMTDGLTGETIALETSCREFEFTVGGAVTAAKGDILYIADDTNALINTDTEEAFGKVTIAKDGNDVVWVKTLENGA